MKRTTSPPQYLLTVSLLLALLLFLPTVQAEEWCFQETANETVTCNQISAGWYTTTGTWDTLKPISYLYDEDYTTWQRTTPTPSSSSFYIYYPHSKDLSNLTQWQVKDGGDGLFNITIPNYCSYSNTLQLWINVTDQGVPGENTSYSCFDGSSWQELHNSFDLVTGGQFYEEAMYFNYFGANLTFTGATSGLDYTDDIYCTFNSITLDTGTGEISLLDKDTTNTISCTAGTGFQASNFNITTTNITQEAFTLQVPEYVLNISLDDNTTGDITWVTTIPGGIRNWTDSSVIYATNELCSGTACYATVEFNYDNYGKQIYEFYNDFSSDHVTTLHVIDNMNNFMYLQAVGLSNDPLNDVKIQAFLLDEGTGSQNYTQIGQRYTEDDGMTTFYTRSDDYIMITATKAGYQTAIHGLPANEFNNLTAATPYKIEMLPSSSYTIGDGVAYVSHNTIDNTTETIEILMNTDDEYFEYSTSYNPTRTRVSSNALDIAHDILEKDTDYTDAAFTIYLYNTEGVNIYNHSIYYNNVEKRDVFSNLPTVDAKYTVPFILIILITLSIIIGASINKQESTAGMHTFFIGSMALIFIAPQLWGAALVGCIYYVLTYLYNTQETR
jgi:hypothetical protein